MVINPSIPVNKLAEISDIGLKEVYIPKNSEKMFIYSAELNRPGLLLAGFSEYFDKTRIQIIGKVEHTYLEHMEKAERYARLENLFSMGIPALVVTRSLEIYPEILELAEKYNVAIFSSTERTSKLFTLLIIRLTELLAPMVIRHGVLMEVYGEGILITGDSGVGKSETAIELVKRGHRLIADDAVEIKRINEHTLSGSAPEIIRHFIELRGIGIIDVKNIFGMGSVKNDETIDMVIHLEPWNDDKNYDRLGMDTEYTKILDVDVPYMLIPVKQGRNLAVILEVAAMNNKQRRMGYNAAGELNKKFIEKYNNKEKK